MWKYILQRCLWMILIVIGVAFVIFTILYLVPGNPAELLLPAGATREQIQAVEVSLGLDKSYIEQLGIFLYDTFIKLDFGTSWASGGSVMKELFSRLPLTLSMSVATLIIGAAAGLPLGVSAATHHGRWQDYGVLGVCMVFISLPQFWVSLEAVVIFSQKLGWLPAYGMGGIKNYILPVLGGSLFGIANNARQMRSSMLEVIRADFITTARAKGQSEKVIVSKHMIPNAMMPVITVLGNTFTQLIIGMTLTEKIFGLPGVGLYLLNGVNVRDYPVVRGCTIFFALFCAVIMLIIDLCYAWLDPRIKAQYKNTGRRKSA